MQAQAAGTWPAQPNYIEEVFSTYLYTGTAASQTVTNGIDLSSKGGLVWVKNRSGAYDHILVDTVRGTSSGLATNTTGAAGGSGNFTSFNTDGFSFTGSANGRNNTGNNYASWTFREQAKFFDIVTYTGNSTSGRTIAHNLGSAPGCMIVKITSSADQWCIYHRSQGATKYGLFNTDEFSTYSGTWNDTAPTSSVFTVGNDSFVNASGSTYVAYLFAHDAGGFGLTGADNVITCGSYTGNGSASGPSVTLGYEPQFVIIKAAANARTSPTSYNNWAMVDVMRGMPSPSTGTGYALGANLSTAENGGFLAANSTVVPTATGFQIGANESMYNFSGCTYIYIAIRRGPMKTPTVGTSVFSTDFAVATAPQFQSSTITTGVDSSLTFYTPGYNDGTNAYPEWFSRLTTQFGLQTANTRAQNDRGTNAGKWDFMNGFWNTTGGGSPYGAWHFKRAPSFFDEVCYTGTGTPTNFTHNLGAVPELMIVKRLDNPSIWAVYAAPLANAATNYFQLNTDDAVTTGNTVLWNSTAPTSTVFTIGASTNINTVGSTNVAYLFATCAGVSKVGSYTGTGALQTVNCGFTSGARFVLIKRTDSTGDWYVWDSTRGIVPGNDPYLTLNTYNAEVTGTDYIDTTNVGFDVTSTAPAALNANGGTYIFLAIA
jgi:hypothetical protein